MYHQERFLGGVGKAILGGISGGGKTETKQALKSLNEIITDVSLEQVQKCASSVSLNQKVKIVARGGSVVNIGDINMNQVAQLKGICSISSSQETDILNKIEAKLRTVAQAKTSPLSRFLNGDFESNVNIDVTSKIVNAISQVDISSCINNMALKQEFDIEGLDGSVIVVGAIDMQQVAGAVSECIMDSTQFVGIVGDLFEHMDSQITSEQEGIPNPLELLDNLSTTMLYAAAAVFALVMLIVIVAIIVILIKK